MGKYKVVVYAISKNESDFVDRWVKSMSEADSIYVLDTGSTDDTVEKLKSYGVHVSSCTINPWRFDIVRNLSLALVPEDADICVCTDLDEVFDENWRTYLEESWDNSNRLSYIYNWSLDNDGKPLITFMYEKIHSRNNYSWIYPVHEVLKYDGDDEKKVVDKRIHLNHYPDKSKSRSSYLPLLELAVKENPLNDRMMHYLGREYMYYGMYDKSIETLKKHLKLPTSTWKEERCASLRFISRCLIKQNKIDDAYKYLNDAINECPYSREPYLEMAFLEFNRNNFLETIKYLIKAKTIDDNKLIYINEIFCHDDNIDDLLSISYYNLGLKDEALYYVDKALLYNPKSERLNNNKRIFQEN